MAAARAGTIVNISGTTPIDDPEYRYKMPVVFGKIEGRGNGIKTVIPNISEVSNSLHRHPGEVNKFFGCELGAQTTYSADTDRAVVNGAHTDATLQQLIHRYIEIFVLCPNCGLPETVYKIKNDTIWHKCAACGAKEMVDMGHKLCTYILAQDKKAKKEGKSNKKASKSKDKDDADADKKKKKKSKDKDADDGEKKKKNSNGKDKDKDKKKKKKDEDEESSDADQQNDDYIKEAMFGKKEKTIDDLADEAHDDDDDDDDDVAGVDDVGAMNLAVEGTRTFISENPDASPVQIAKVVKNQQMASALKSQDKIHIFIRAAITDKFAKEKEIERFASTIVEITQSNPIMERHLIGALELLCVSKPKAFVVALKQLFDADALEEDSILDWASEGRSEYTPDAVDEEARANLRGEAEPLIVWLQEEDDSDDDDED